MAVTQEAAKKALAEDQKVVAQSRAEYNERMKGKPVPSQEECDLIKLGAPVSHKQASGAGPDPRTRSMEAGPTAAPYSTRAARAST